MTSIACGYYKDEYKKIRKFKVNLLDSNNDFTLAVDGNLPVTPNRHLTFINKILPFPKRTREVVYIAGPSGSGKSSYACNYIKQFYDEHPDNDIYIFTGIKNDEAINSLIQNHDDQRITTIDINDELVADPIKLDDFKDGDLILFDDVCQIYEEKLKECMMNIIRELLEIGRHKNLYVVITNHLINPVEKKFGRMLMNELTSLTIFPQSGATKSIRYCLDTYFGLKNIDINKILKLKSRWVTIQRNFPQTVIYDTGIYIL